MSIVLLSILLYINKPYLPHSSWMCAISSATNNSSKTCLQMVGAQEIALTLFIGFASKYNIIVT